MLISSMSLREARSSSKLTNFCLDS